MADDLRQKYTKGLQPKRFPVGRIALVVIGCIGLISTIAYAYDLGFRQGARHAPPLMTADTTPTKMPPSAPGGIKIPHQDKLVYQRLSTARATVETRAETLLPPPEEPMPTPLDEALPQDSQAKTIVSDSDPANVSTAGIKEVNDGDPAAAAVGIALATRAVPTDTNPVPSHKAKATSLLANTIKPKAPAKPRFAALPTTTKPAIIKPTVPLASAIYTVQVGSFRQGYSARAGWQRLLKQHAALIAQMPHRVAKADVGGGKGIYHRLQVGAFETRRAAGALCQKLKSQSQDCLVVKR